MKEISFRLVEPTARREISDQKVIGERHALRYVEGGTITSLLNQLVVVML
jgi:hypothetical protein